MTDFVLGWIAALLIFTLSGLLIFAGIHPTLFGPHTMRVYISMIVVIALITCALIRCLYRARVWNRR